MTDEKVSEEFKKRLTEMILDESDRDFELAEKLKDRSKDMDSCCAYVLQEVFDSKFSGFSDQEVVNMAKNYWKNDEPKKLFTGQCKVVINSHLEFTEEEKREAKERALRELVEEEKSKMKSRGRVQQKNANENVQPDLFGEL